MHRNIEEYYKKYINTYPLYNHNIEDKKIISESSLNLYSKKNNLFLFVSFIIIISFGFCINFVNGKISNYNFNSLNQFYYKDNILSKNFNQITLNNKESKIINNLYSEKFTDSQNNELNFSKNSHLNELIFLGAKLTNKFSYKFAQNKTPKIKDFLMPNWQKNYSATKREFIETLLPLIAYENQKISFERRDILRIKDSLLLNKTLNEKDFLYIKNISKKYSVEFDKKHKIDSIEELLIKVDLIPPSIVLAQAANESGWGKSRFAKEYNALFGQYTYDKKNGIVPFEREEGKRHLIRNFTSIDKSVEAYFINLNSHYSYKDFRNSRLKYKNSKSLVSYLTKDLEVYAEDENYVNTINSIIKTNNFKIFDDKIFSFINS